MYNVYTLLFFSQSLGQLGSVQGVDNDGNVAVLMKTHLWTFNPLCVRQAEKEEEQAVSSQFNNSICAHVVYNVCTIVVHIHACACIVCEVHVINATIILLCAHACYITNTAL